MRQILISGLPFVYTSLMNFIRSKIASKLTSLSHIGYSSFVMRTVKLLLLIDHFVMVVFWLCQCLLDLSLSVEDHVSVLVINLLCWKQSWLLPSSCNIWSLNLLLIKRLAWQLEQLFIQLMWGPDNLSCTFIASLTLIEKIQYKFTFSQTVLCL